MSRTDRASLLVNAPVERVFRALVEREALETWLAPTGMTARLDLFDPRPGGSYRLVLTYADAASPQSQGPSKGKSTADSDVVEARYVDIAANERVVQAVHFESEDTRFTGTMTMTWAVRSVDGGTLVEFTAEDVPEGISAEDHAAGMTSSLEHLATYVGS